MDDGPPCTSGVAPAAFDALQAPCSSSLFSGGHGAIHGHDFKQESLQQREKKRLHEDPNAEKMD